MLIQLWSFCPNLESLQIKMSNFTSEPLLYLFNSCHLKALTLYGTCVASESELNELDIPTMRNLISLDIGIIDSNAELRNAFNQFIIKHVRDLEHFRISNVFMSMSNLQELLKKVSTNLNSSVLI